MRQNHQRKSLKALQVNRLLTLLLFFLISDMFPDHVLIQTDGAYALYTPLETRGYLPLLSFLGKSHPN